VLSNPRRFLKNLPTYLIRFQNYFYNDTQIITADLITTYISSPCADLRELSKLDVLGKNPQKLLKFLNEIRTQYLNKKFTCTKNGVKASFTVAATVRERQSGALHTFL
jgi:hypothetical protein